VWHSFSSCKAAKKRLDQLELDCEHATPQQNVTILTAMNHAVALSMCSPTVSKPWLAMMTAFLLPIAWQILALSDMSSTTPPNLSYRPTSFQNTQLSWV
jgi:hypothetical protein